MPKLYQTLSKPAPESGQDRWLIAVPGIVADNDDPERQHRIKVIIPSIDEDKVFDEWARQIGCFVGPPGYGSFCLPPIGGEVVLFGAFGQKHNLYYASVYNEDFVAPTDFPDETVAGLRLPGDVKIIAECDGQLRAGRWRIEADASIELLAPAGVFLNGRKL